MRRIRWRENTTTEDTRPVKEDTKHKTKSMNRDKQTENKKKKRRETSKQWSKTTHTALQIWNTLLNLHFVALFLSFFPYRCWLFSVCIVRLVCVSASACTSSFVVVFTLFFVRVFVFVVLHSYYFASKYSRSTGWKRWNVDWNCWRAKETDKESNVKNNEENNAQTNKTTKTSKTK